MDPKPVRYLLFSVIQTKFAIQGNKLLPLFESIGLLRGGEVSSFGTTKTCNSHNQGRLVPSVSPRSRSNEVRDLKSKLEGLKTKADVAERRSAWGGGAIVG